jgi:hypothetical protein
MYASSPTSASSSDSLIWSETNLQTRRISTGEHYCVSAVPATYALTDDVIIRDLGGNPYLLSHDSLTPTPLASDEVDSLGMFYEPAQDSSWHTVSELRRIIYGVVEEAQD